MLLNFGDYWKVESVETNIKTEEIDVYLAFIGNDAECPLTGEALPIYDHREQRRWRHLDTMQYKTFINARVPRVKNIHGKVRTISIPWAGNNERHSYLFESAVINLLKATKNQTKTAQFMSCGFNIVNRIIHNATKRGLSRRDQGVEFEWLSIDEKSFKKGHTYATILSDPRSGCIIDLAEGRSFESCKELINNTLGEDQKQAVKKISMDMWKAYIKLATEEMPMADIVHDRFHLMKYLNEAVDKVRRRESKDQEELIGSRYLWLKNESNHTERQKIAFEAIDKTNFITGKAWQVKENFKSLFGCKAYQHAFDFLVLWGRNAVQTQIKEIIKVVKMFAKHGEGVINALINNLSNAMAERLNGKIQEIKTIGKGYRTFKNFRSVVLFFNGGLSLYPQSSW
ncbi:MAG: ISL3 family transposase [Gammaproteobacteria bacterium]|nr:ISL3 family transposase [Gammaproteobacteria bacterium]